MFKNLNRGISTPIAIGIIAVLVVVVGGGILAYQYYYITEKEQPKSLTPDLTPEVTPTPHITLNVDNLLGKMFPGYEVKNGKIKILKDELVDIEISIDKTLEDNPVSLDENRILLIAEMIGVPHFYGGYGAFLSVFDLNGNLLTSSFSIPKPSAIGDLVREGEGSLDVLKRENGAFAQKGNGQFFFYNCKGTKYILFEEKFCVTAMCYGYANLYKVEGSKFIDVQKITSVDSLTEKAGTKNIVFAAAEDATKNIIVIPSEDKISIYRGKNVPAGFICPTKCLDWSGKPIETISWEGAIYIFYKELSWDNNSCRFE